MFQMRHVNIKGAPRPLANGRGGQRGRQFGGCQTVALISIMLLALRGESENVFRFPWNNLHFLVETSTPWDSLILWRGCGSVQWLRVPTFALSVGTDWTASKVLSQNMKSTANWFREGIDFIETAGAPSHVCDRTHPSSSSGEPHTSSHRTQKLANSLPHQVLMTTELDTIRLKSTQLVSQRKCGIRTGRITGQKRQITTKKFFWEE